MKSIHYFGLAVALVIIVGSTTLGQCQQPGMTIMPTQYYTPLSESYSWVAIPGNPRRIACYKGVTQVGIYDFDSGFYWGYRDGRWTGAATSPITPPLNGLAGNKANGHTFGVVGTNNGPERIWEGQTDYSRIYLESKLRAELKDDSKHGHISVISKDAAVREQAQKDWDTRIAQRGEASGARVQVYDPDAPPNKAILAPHRLDIDRGFQQSGTAIIAQAAASGPDGTSKDKRWYQYTGEEIWIEALRLVNKDYDPNKSPFPSFPGLPTLPTEALVLAGLAGLAGVAWLRHQKH